MYSIIILEGFSHYNLHVSFNIMATKEHFLKLNLQRNLSLPGTNRKTPDKKTFVRIVCFWTAQWASVFSGK